MDKMGGPKVVALSLVLTTISLALLPFLQALPYLGCSAILLATTLRIVKRFLGEAEPASTSTATQVAE